MPHFMVIVEPRKKLLCKDRAFVLEVAAQVSFCRVTHICVTHTFNPDFLVAMITDASGSGLGAVLKQQAENKLLNQRNYSVGRKKTLHGAGSSFTEPTGHQ